MKNFCPICKEKSLEYESVVFEENMMYFPYYCNKCRFEGEEWYEMKFVGHNSISFRGEQLENIDVEYTKFYNVSEDGIKNTFIRTHQGLLDLLNWEIDEMILNNNQEDIDIKWCEDMKKKIKNNRLNTKEVIKELKDFGFIVKRRFI